MRAGTVSGARRYIALLECNCSICTRKGFLHLLVLPEDFELMHGGEDLATYQFNTNTAKHTFCRHCGIHPSMCRVLTPTRSASTPAASTASTRRR